MATSLCIDIGNTRIKAGWFNGSVLLKTFSFLKGEFHLRIKELLKLNAEQMIVSSVAEGKRDLEILEEHTSKVMYLSHTTKIPLINLYQSPETLGNDRLAAAVGAMSIFPNSTILVIDAGTCITLDLLSGKSEYLGGSISPGIQMRLQSMHQFTARLPLIEWKDNFLPEQIGNTTEHSLLSGAVNGSIAELSARIQRISAQYAELKILISGGDSHFFEKELKNGIFADQNLVLKGLNEILLYNCENL